MKGDKILKKEVSFTKFENELIFEINNKLNFGCGMVYITLLSHKNKNEGMADSCFPSYNILKKELNMSKTTISKYLSQLEQAGYIIIKSGKYNTQDMHNESNRYYFPKSDISVTCYSEDEYYELFKDLIKPSADNNPFDENPFKI